jgi:hypothetical protein
LICSTDSTDVYSSHVFEQQTQSCKRWSWTTDNRISSVTKTDLNNFVRANSASLLGENPSSRRYVL